MELALVLLLRHPLVAGNTLVLGSLWRHVLVLGHVLSLVLRWHGTAVVLLVWVLQLKVWVLLLELAQLILRVHLLFIQALPSFILLKVTSVGHVQELLVAQQTILVCVSLLQNMLPHALYLFVFLHRVGAIVTRPVQFLHL